MYPASVVKLFYLAYAEHLLETGELKDTPELQRGLSEMFAPLGASCRVEDVAVASLSS